tara:strand:- start:2135 stop:2467 length:333 start_codon:yes stop_codon:yes gene_type:complete
MFYAKITYEKDKKIQEDIDYLEKLKYITEKLYINNINDIYNNSNNSNTDIMNLQSYFKNIYNDLIKKKFYFYKLKKFLIKNNLTNDLIDVNIEIKNIKKGIKKYYKLLNL